MSYPIYDTYAPVHEVREDPSVLMDTLRRLENENRQLEEQLNAMDMEGAHLMVRVREARLHGEDMRHNLAVSEAESTQLRRDCSAEQQHRANVQQQLEEMENNRGTTEEFSRTLLVCFPMNRGTLGRGRPLEPPEPEPEAPIHERVPQDFPQRGTAVPAATDTASVSNAGVSASGEKVSVQYNAPAEAMRYVQEQLQPVKTSIDYNTPSSAVQYQTPTTQYAPSAVTTSVVQHRVPSNQYAPSILPTGVVHHQVPAPTYAPATVPPGTVVQRQVPGYAYPATGSYYS